MHTTDREAMIIEQLHRGDTEAVKYIYNIHYQPLCYFAERLTGNKSEAEDIAIESILKLLETKERFDSLSNIKAFLYISVRNACFNFLRAMQRHNSSHREIFYLTPEGEEDAKNEMVLARVLQEIYEQIETLPPQCREIFKLIFLERKTTAEIAKLLGISSQTVLNQKSIAIRMLRSTLLKKELLMVIVAALLQVACHG